MTWAQGNVSVCASFTMFPQSRENMVPNNSPLRPCRSPKGFVPTCLPPAASCPFLIFFLVARLGCQLRHEAYGDLFGEFTWSTTW